MTEGRFRRLARNRDFTVLWAGQAVSELGNTMSLFVFPLVAYALTGSAFAAAIVSAAFSLGSVLVALPAGALVDRWNRRQVMAIATGAGTVLFTALGTVLMTASRSIRSVPKPSEWSRHQASRATAPSGPEVQHAKS